MIGYGNGTSLRLSEPVIAYRQFRMAGTYLRPMRFVEADLSGRLVATPAYDAALDDYTFRCVKSGMRHLLPNMSPDCRCGFYTYYGPDTDFYRTDTWDFPHVNLRGVVEVWGDTIWCLHGIRSQYMSVLGLSVDWAQARPGVDRRKTQARLLALGAAYRISTFDTADDMHAAFPEPRTRP